MNKIVVALPAYNEEEYIGSMVNAVQKYASEVFVLNDGSIDRTAEIAMEAGATVISHAKNEGYGATIRSIIAEGKKREFDAFVIIDSDTQHNPSDIPNMVAPIINGYDLAIGSRNVKDVPRWRYLGGSVLSWFTRVLSGKKIADSQCGFRAFSPRAIRELELKENGMAISSEMVVEASRKGLKMIEVPISIRYTKDSSTLNPVYQGFYTLYRIFVMMVKEITK